ncbi:MAG TPA: hypothetical protein VNE62_06605 [Actinomycetota bacterium]|nr:hypothetical protein [Actinomycetota bacterium]
MRVEERDIVAFPPTRRDIEQLATRAGGPLHLVRPSRRDEVQDIRGEALLAWLVEDPSRMVRPIIETEDDLLLGFEDDVRERLEKLTG